MVVDFLIRFCQNIADNIVASRRHPERSRLTLITKIVDHRPRVENFCLSESIPVVPLAYFIIFIGSVVVFCHLHHFVGSKPKVGAVFIIQY